MEHPNLKMVGMLCNLVYLIFQEIVINCWLLRVGEQDFEYISKRNVRVRRM